ncbi:MAG: D-alanyl-D-alanine carboxypeptidase/D-alanyl-D-alanine-endopeptidase [Chlamydiales bacterium]
MPRLFCEEFDSLDHAIVSLYALDCETGEVLFEKNSALSLVPASCMKIVTTTAALHLLGAESRFETYLEYDGVLDETLEGNLYIRGGGDPCLGSDRIPGSLSWKEQIEVWADAVQKLGIRNIVGKVIGDASRWERALAVPSWSWEDLGNYYGAGASALSFHENAYSLVFQPGKRVGEEAVILRTEPPLPTLVLQNEVKTGPEGSGDHACIYGMEFSPTQFVRGTIPAAAHEFAIRGAIPDPAAACASWLMEELKRRGIAVGQQKMAQQKERTVFHTSSSPTIREIVHWTNQKSINLYAEHLLKKMGEVRQGEGSTAAGVRAVAGFWKSQKIELGGFNMIDGSGLSRKNLITATQLVEMLVMMKKSDLFPVFLESLPQYQGSIRAKNGTMSLVKGYAGYAGKIAFAILVNQCLDPRRANQAIDEFFSQLCQK